MKNIVCVCIQESQESTSWTGFLLPQGRSRAVFLRVLWQTGSRDVNSREVPQGREGGTEGGREGGGCSREMFQQVLREVLIPAEV